MFRRITKSEGDPVSLKRALLLAFALALVLAGCASKSAERAVSPVKVMKLESGTLAKEVSADGQAKALRTATVTSAVSGKVVRIAVKVGDRVEAGQPLIWVEDPLAPSQLRRLQAAVEGARVQVESARITTAQSAEQKSSDIEQGESDVKVAAIAVVKAQASLEAAETELTRKQDLLVKKAIAQTDVEKARLVRDQSKADLNSAQVKLAAEKERLAATRVNLSVDIQRSQEGAALASLRQAEADLESALAQQVQETVLSPIAGLVSQSNVQLGQDPSKMSEPLLTIVDESSLRVEAKFDERYASDIRPGLRAEARPVVDPNQLISLVVERVTPQSQEALLAVELRPVDGKGPRLTVDSYIRVRLDLETPSGILVPVAGIVWDSDGDPTVMLAQAGKAKSRKVRIVNQSESHALVSEETLQAGELLIFEGQTGLADGAEIRVVNE